MDVEVFIYGTPTGNCLYGKIDEKNYFDTFYKSDKENYLSVKIRKAGDNKVYCYYNYLVYKNVIGKNGRPNSFFGITLRLDAYCMDIQNVYRILEMTFNSYIIGELLEGIGGNLRYIVGDFNDTLKLKSIEDSVIGLFSRTFKGKENVCFALIDHTFTIGGDKFYEINLYDYSDNDIFRSIKKIGQIRTSPYFPTQKIGELQQQHEKQMEEIRQQYELDKKAEVEERIQLSSSLSDSNNRIINLQSELEQKKRDIEQLNEKIKNIDRAKEFEHLIEQIKIPIEKISDYIGYTAPVVAGKIVRRGRKWYSRLFEIIRKGIPFANMFLIVVILLCIRGYIPLNRSEDEETVRLTEAVERLENEKKELEKQLEVSRIPEKGIKIDIADFNGETLKKGNSYKARAILSEKSFRWEVDGAKMKKEEERGDIILQKITSDTIRIRLLMNGETMVAERTIPSK